MESLASSLQISTKRLIWLRAKSTGSSSQCSLLKGIDNKTVRTSFWLHLEIAGNFVI